MKKIFKLENLDCANCATKMENNIRKIEGVTNVSVSFMTQKMTVEADNSSFDTIIEKVISVCKKVEPDCKIIM